MASDGEDVNSINESSATNDSGEAHNERSKLLEDLARFLEGLLPSWGLDDVEKQTLDEILKQLSKSQLNIQVDDIFESTVLHIAVERGLVWATERLLEKGASVSTINCDRYTPLHLACIYGYEDIVKLLLKDSNIHATDVDEDTPLHLACIGGHPDIVKLLLEHSKVQVTDDEESIPSHRAAMQNHGEHTKPPLNSGAIVDRRNAKGYTPLMAAVEWGYYSIVEILLRERGYAQTRIRDNKGKTPLQLAMEDENSTGVDILIKYMPDEDKRQPELYQKLLLYEVPIHGEEKRSLSKMTRNSILEALKSCPGTFNKALLWAAFKFERHGIAKTLLIWGTDEMDEQQQPSEPSVIEVATKQGRPDILWWLIATSPNMPRIRKNVTSALSKAKEREKAEPTPANVGRSGLGSKPVNRDKTDEGDHDATAPADGNQHSAWTLMKDILEDPPIAQFYVDSAILGPPRLNPNYSNLIEGFKALIARFYKAKNASGTIRRTRNLVDTVYDKGPTRIMTAAISNLEKIIQQNLENGDGNSGLPQDETPYSHNNLKFTYIHLPATNIEWMKDLLLRIIVDEKIVSSAAGSHEINSWFQSTWLEIPDRSSDSRFMRPQFVERTRVVSASGRQDKGLTSKRTEEQKASASNEEQPGEVPVDTDQKTTSREAYTKEANRRETTKKKRQGEDSFIPSSALYMPFLSFATQTEYHNYSQQDYRQGNSEERDEPGKKLKKLIETYKGSVVHSSATLDEAYYHFDSEDTQAQSDRKRRNRNQIVTKQLKEDAKNRKESQRSNKDWPLLRVNQIWVWTIADKWVISATSHPVDDVEQLWLDGFTEYLNKQVEATGAQSQPGSARDMVKAIVDYCIGSYERRRTYRNPDSQDPSREWITGLSIRQLFSNYINNIGRGETDLFTKLRKHENGLDTSKLTEKFKDATTKAETLFSETNDIRDELNIIKSVVQYQQTVQKKLLGKDAADSGLTKNIIDDIMEMERLAKRIQSSVNSTLSLIQSKIANLQAEESVIQSKAANTQAEQSIQLSKAANTQADQSIKISIMANTQAEETAKQGKSMMVFTLTTSVFLPLSFLTSLFALDVGSFQEAPPWAFGIIFGVALGFTALTFCVLFYASIAEFIHKKSRLPMDEYLSLYVLFYLNYCYSWVFESIHTRIRYVRSYYTSLSKFILEYIPKKPTKAKQYDEEGGGAELAEQPNGEDQSSPDGANGRGTNEVNEVGPSEGNERDPNGENERDANEERGGFLGGEHESATNEGNGGGQNREDGRGTTEGNVGG